MAVRFLVQCLSTMTTLSQLELNHHCTFPYMVIERACCISMEQCSGTCQCGTLENENTSGKNDGIQLWEREDTDYVLSDVPMWALEDTGVCKCEPCPDNQSIFLAITEDHCLVVLQALAGLVIITNVWDKKPVKDFVFCVPSLDRCKPKACVLTAPSEQKLATINLVTLPGLEVAHSVAVSPTASLCVGIMSEECLLFTDSDGDRANGLHICQLVLASGEDKLQRLILQKKFTEAETYALSNGLDVELVYKAQAEFLLEAASKLSDKSISKKTDELIACLKKIKDVRYVCELCVTSSMMSYDLTNTLLQYCYQFSGTDSSHGEIHTKISGILHKLTTFQLVHGAQEFSVPVWQSFLNTGVVDAVKTLLQQGDFSRAAYVWTTSLGELLEVVDTAVMVDILKAIPGTASSQLLTSWISDIMLPFILQQLPLMLKDFLSWAESIVYGMEVNEKEQWPTNGLSMVTAIQRLLHSFKSDMFVGRDALYKLWEDLVSQLSDMCYLQTQFQFSVSLAHHSKVTSEEIVYQLLDRVTVPELVVSIVDSQVRPYCDRHKLNVDVVLLNYVRKPGNQMKSASEFALERKIVALVKSIGNKQYQVNGCMELVIQPVSRWSKEMEQLVKTCLSYSCAGIEELASRYKWMCLKKILLEYGITDTPSVNVTWNLVKLIRYILRRPNSLSDALQVAEHYQLPEADVHYYHIQNLFLAGEFPSAWEALHSLSDTIGCTVSSDLFTSSLEYAAQAITINCGTEHIRAITTCVLCLEYLKEKGTTEMIDSLLVYVSRWDCNVDWFLHQLRCLQTLAEKYSIHLSLDQLSDKHHCTRLLDKLTEQYLSPTSSPDNQEAGGASNTCMPSASNLVSVASLLGLSETEIYRKLLKKLCEMAPDLDQQKFSSVLTALGNNPDKETAIILKQCMTEVWKMVTAETASSLDQQQKLLELLDTLSTKAIMISPPGQLEECVEMWRVLRLCIITGRQCKDNMSFSTIEFQPQEEHTCYDLWCWPRRYVESGMILDYEAIMPLVMSEASVFVGTKPDQSSAMLSLCKPLANNALHQLALDWALMTYHHYLQQETSNLSGKHIPPKAQMIKECGFAINGLLKTMMSKVLSAKRLEHFYGLSLLLSCQPQTSRKQLSLEGLHHRMDSGHYTTIQGMCQLGLDYGSVTGDHEVTSLAGDYYKHASWGRKLEPYKVPVAMAGDKSAGWKVVSSMMKEPRIPLSMILDYCKDYNLDCDEVLVHYLTIALEEWPHGYQGVTSDIVELLKNSEWLEKFFCDLLDKISPYDYERISFVLEQLKLFGTEEWSPSENLSLLRQLQQYSRVSAPPQCELQFYQHHLAVNAEIADSMVVQDKSLPAESKHRLPFHALLEETLAESILAPELYPHTINKLLRIAEELKISAENCYGLAIKNEFAAHPKDIVIDNIVEIISKIDDISVAISAAKWAVRQLKSPEDADKRAKVLQKAIELVKKCQAIATSPKEKEKATSSLDQLTKAYQAAMAEQLLVEYNIALPQYVAQAETIGLVITSLYTDVPQLGTIPVHEVVDKLLALKPQLKFSKIQSKLLDTWLHSRGRSHDTTVDQDITQTNISFSCVDEENTAEDDDNYKRLTYLLSKRDHLESNVKHLLNMLKVDTSVMPTRTKVTVFKVLFAIAPKKLLEKISNTSATVLSSQYQVLLFLCELEWLHVRLNPDEFQSINKLGVIHQLLKNHSHEPRAMWLAVEMCQHFHINDTLPWTALLKQMHTLGMLVHIRKLLIGLSSQLCVSLVPVLTSIWDPVIMYPFKQGVNPQDQPAECQKSIELLLKVDIPVFGTIEHFVMSLWGVGFRLEALFCCSMLRLGTQKWQTVNDLLKNITPRECVAVLDKATSVSLLYSKSVTEILYNYINHVSKFELVIGTPHFQSLVVYLVEKDQMENLLVATLKAKRLTDAIKLTDLYYHTKENFSGTEALREYISTHGLETTITEL
ncbi:kinetochore-associated protein 1-like isoform X2 [Dysidea avara]|uniref:kinetochore-associated protein 1-like isoform X2 n=1 Tax=Dysidea avara TaxID=196820 RepID=UPI00331783F7